MSRTDKWSHSCETVIVLITSEESQNLSFCHDVRNNVFGLIMKISKYSWLKNTLRKWKTINIKTGAVSFYFFFLQVKTMVNFLWTVWTHFSDRKRFCFGPLFTKHLPSSAPATDQALVRHGGKWQICTYINIYIYLYLSIYNLFQSFIWCHSSWKVYPPITTWSFANMVQEWVFLLSSLVRMTCRAARGKSSGRKMMVRPIHLKGRSRDYRGQKTKWHRLDLATGVTRERENDSLNSIFAGWQSQVQHILWIAASEGPEPALSMATHAGFPYIRAMPFWVTNMRYIPKDKLEWLLTHIIRGQTMSLLIMCVLFLPVSGYWWVTIEISVWEHMTCTRMTVISS